MWLTLNVWENELEPEDIIMGVDDIIDYLIANEEANIRGRLSGGRPGVLENVAGRSREGDGSGDNSSRGRGL